LNFSSEYWSVRLIGFSALRVVVACVFVCFLVACKVDLHTQLSENDANDVVATIQTAGLQAFKRRLNDKDWAVEVHESDFAAAVDVLKTANLPREKFSNLGQIFKREGLVSSPTEERIRFVYATEQELARTLSEIDGVLVARVHIVIPSKDSLSDKVKPSSASVFIKHKAGLDFKEYLPTIRGLVTRSVEGLQPDGVTVTALPSSRPENMVQKNAPLRWWGITVTGVDSTLLWLMWFVVLLPLTVLVLVCLRYRHHLQEDWQALHAQWVDWRESRGSST
jgi:type III secretion protein J